MNGSKIVSGNKIANTEFVSDESVPGGKFVVEVTRNEFPIK